MKKLFAFLTTVILLTSINFFTVTWNYSKKVDIDFSYSASSNITIDAVIPAPSSGNQPGRKS